MLRRIANNDRTFRRLKPDEQADLAQWTARGIPRQPDAIRMTERRLAVVLLELLGREDVLPIRLRLFDVATGFVEGVDHEGPVHLDRLAPFGVVEHQPTAEAARRRLHSFAQDRVGPDGDDFHGGLRFAVFSRAPGNVLRQVELVDFKRRTTAERDERGHADSR